jgi:hypothetical protein
LAIRRVPLPPPRVTPKAIGFAQRRYAQRREEIQVTRFAPSVAIFFGVRLCVHSFPHREDAETGARHGADPLKNVPRLEQTALPLVGFDLQLANLNPYDLAVDVAFQQEFLFALTQFG